MPSNHPALGALPFRFRRERLLIVGCGDVGLRVARMLPSQRGEGQARRGIRILALTSSPERVPALRLRGITPLLGNLDDAASLHRLAGLATRLIHLAPPPTHKPTERSDPRTLALMRSLRQRSLPQSLVYGSTSGVYGDCQGQWVSETRQTQATTARGQRRVQAEAQVRLFGRATGVRSHVLRIPGIYAPDREGGTPRDRLAKGTPVLATADDVFTNHIHADDLARACIAALWRGKPQRITHASDDSQLKMGDYFDLAADLYGLPRPPRLTRSEALAQLPAPQMSFMSESRRLNNLRLKKELTLTLRFPTVKQGLLDLGGSAQRYAIAPPT